MTDTKLAADETELLIASDKVEGTAVYDLEGTRLGSVLNFMVNKHSGRVEYAVMAFGELFGMKEEYHPLPWDQLTYDTIKGGYVVKVTKEQLRDGPRHRGGDEPSFGRRYGQQVYSYYNSSPSVASGPSIG